MQLRDPKYAEVFTQMHLGPDVGPASPMVARPGASIVGKVIHEDGSPAEEILLQGFARRIGSAYALTEADGSFRMESLKAGVFDVAVKDRSGEWVAPPVTGVIVAEGQEVPIDDIVLTKGTTIEGVVVSENTGKPREGIGVYVYGEHESWHSPGAVRTATDKKGRFTVRVIPGKKSIQLYSQIRYASPKPAARVDAEKGKKNFVRIELPEEVVVSGRMLDTDGKPITNERVRIRIQIDGTEEQTGGRTTTDDAGRFTFKNLAAGKANISADIDYAKWETVEPKDFDVPTPEPVKVVLKRLKHKLVTVSGRVVAADGKPVEGAVVKLEVRAPGGWEVWVRPKTVATDAGGRFSIPGQREGVRVELESVQKPGYKHLSGGRFAEKDGALVMSEIIMAPLTGNVEGRVVNSVGDPVGGAKVTSLTGWPDAQATTDESGKFVLTSVPEGEVTVIAACNLDAGQAQVRTGEDPVEVVLKPATRVEAGNVDLGLTVLKEAWTNSEGGNYRRRKYIPLEIAPHDPDLALELARRSDGNVPDFVLSGAVATIALLDPARAAEWAPDKLDEIKNTHLQCWAVLALALGVVDTNRDLASQLYDRANKIVFGERSNEHIATEMGNLVALAAKLDNGEAESLVDKTLSTRFTKGHWAGKTVAEVPSSMEYFAGLIARGSPDLAEKVVSGLPSREYASAIGGLARQVAGCDVDAARRLLAELDEMPGQSMADYCRARAAPSVIKAVGATDPEEALALARTVKDERYRPRALEIAASFQSKDAALDALREASAVGAADYNHAVEHMARAAAKAYELDQTVGMQLFAAAREKMNKEREKRRAIPAFASSYSVVDPAESRFMLEAEFARLTEQKEQWGYEALVLAMTPLDIERALEMARSMPNNESGSRFNALRKIGQYALAMGSSRKWTGFDYGYGWRPDMPACLGLRTWIE